MASKNGNENNVPYEESELYRIRHSSAHVMAESVLEFFPDAKLAIGPPIEDGFYYDFDLGKDEEGKPRTFSEEDLEKIEKRMKKLLKQNAQFEHSTMSVEEAKSFFEDEPYKLELIDELAAGKVDDMGEPISEPVDEVSIYQHREFVDLCRGPHVPSTKKIRANAVKLLRTSGAYWRGDENRPQLQRIYGTAWHNRVELEQYLKRLEEIEKRDHRRLGTQLDLFSTAPRDVGGGLILWHPKGGRIRTIIEDFARQQHLEGGYEIVYTPHIGRSHLWETSGHLDFYRESMYSPMDIDGLEYYLKPMNCPFHIMIYQSDRRSYRDLPIRMAEWGTVYRFERSGTLHGLLRVRGFTQDDAHIFCTPDQVEDEISRVLNFSLNLLEAFGFEEFDVELSVRDPATPEKYAGSDEMWEMAEAALVRALEERGLPHRRMEGEAVFYGPKIDIKIKDALGRTWQLTTIQFDFNLPERFGLIFVGEDGQEHRPYMVHRALMGSMERFFGVLIEHYGGAFPVWLAPVQVVMIPITDRHVEYAREVAEQLRAAGMRVEVDDSGNRMSAKIRDAQLQKVPYMLIVGDREVEANTVAVRTRDEEDRGAIPVEEFKEHALNLITTRSQEL
ncbi:MAG: threonine--tRNA ligase [Candidatus Promineifilaceae bacterium]|nr:threonine--tRNA ligase [Candidatus Promineifilaceae bacterium]